MIFMFFVLVIFVRGGSDLLEISLPGFFNRWCVPHNLWASSNLLQKRDFWVQECFKWLWIWVFLKLLVLFFRCSYRKMSEILVSEKVLGLIIYVPSQTQCWRGFFQRLYVYNHIFTIRFRTRFASLKEFFCFLFFFLFSTCKVWCECLMSYGYREQCSFMDVFVNIPNQF